MRKLMVSTAIAGWLFTAGVMGFSATRKAGLWEISTTTTWQKPVGGPGGRGDPAAAGTRKKDVCLTQDMIDKYGALLPQSRGACHIEDKVLSNGGSTARWVCSGKMKGEGTLETNWTDVEHATGTLHFHGTLETGSALELVEWTTQSTSVFKSSSCGNTRPMALPAGTR